MSIMIDDPKFRESKYHGVSAKHPVRYKIFECTMPVKRQEDLKEYLHHELGITIRFVRKNGITYFLSSEHNNSKAVKFCFDKCQFLIDIFELKDINIYLFSLQKGEKPHELY